MTWMDEQIDELTEILWKAKQRGHDDSIGYEILLYGVLHFNPDKSYEDQHWTTYEILEPDGRPISKSEKDMVRHLEVQEACEDLKKAVRKTAHKWGIYKLLDALEAFLTKLESSRLFMALGGLLGKVPVPKVMDWFWRHK